MDLQGGKRLKGVAWVREGSREAPPAEWPRTKGSAWISGLFFALCLPFLEVLLRLSDHQMPFRPVELVRAVFGAGAVGLLLWLVATLIPKKGISRFLTGAVLLGFTVIFVAERCCRAFLGTYFQLGFMLHMSGQVAGDFMDTALGILWKNLWFFPLALLPWLLFVLFRRYLLPERPLRWTLPLVQLLLVVVVQTAAVFLCRSGPDVNFYAWDYHANSAVPRFGLVTSLRLEGQYALLGLPDAQETAGPSVEPQPPAESEQPESTEPTESTEVPKDYGENAMDIDFSGRTTQDSGRLARMDAYFASQTPTKQNAYTGLFAGKNLILFTAESFATPAIDAERTPTLYRLANSGFVFPNFYQPDWSQSTTGGEFAVMTGIIPTWVNGKTSFSASVGKAMPFALGWQFAAQGYAVHAYHNNTYNYYGRDKTHPNLGYPYQGIGNGLELEHPKQWPTSDLELMQATLSDSIQGYLNEGKPFHNYYMTVSGHCDYRFAANDMARKNEAAVAGRSESEPVRAYLACQMELEAALRYTVEALEEAGIAEDTVIVLTGDHYPYAMSEGAVDYYNELTGHNDTPQQTSRYANTLLLWSGCMEEPVVVDTPGCAVDIVPTLSNLFGLEYDARLLSGRDLLAPDVAVGQVGTEMHLAVFADTGFGSSWVSNAGTYEAATDTFTPKPGVQVEAGYVEQVHQIVADRCTYAKYLISEDYYRHLFPDAP